eukprot:3111408-Heterocapsa_arctica.AAC.1
MTRGEATVKKIEAHWELFKRLWSAFERIYIPAVERGASIFIGWPRGCKYWKEAEVVAFQKNMILGPLSLTGACTGLLPCMARWLVYLSRNPGWLPIIGRL